MNTIDPAAVTALTATLMKHAPELGSLYRFPLSTESLRKLAVILGSGRDGIVSSLSKSGGSSDTVLLRDRVQVLLEQEPSLRAPLAKWIITDWGGVGRTAKVSGRNVDTADQGGALAAELAEIQQIVTHAEEWGNEEQKTGKNTHLIFEGAESYSRIARWSKYLAFRHPTSAAIYDSRVVYSLNWLLRKCRTAPLFPMLQPRNSMLNLLGHRALVIKRRLERETFAQEVSAEVSKIKSGTVRKSHILTRLERRAGLLGRRDVYRTYCALLQAASPLLYPNDKWGMTKVEMLLFGMAPTTVAQEVLNEMCGAMPVQ